MTKEAKFKQTDYTRGGRDISNTAIPLYQETLTQMGDYNRNIQNRIDPYMKYINLAQAGETSDFLRNYKRAMGQQTAQNYAATGGGYSSANQLGYDDLQNYYNRLGANLYTSGLGMAEQMANNEYSALYNSLGAYNQAYGLGKDYSYYEQYNDLVDQANDNWLSGLLTSAGDSIGAISMNSNNPWVMAIGGAVGHTMGTAGRMMGNNASDILASLRSQGAGNGGQGQYGSNQSSANAEKGMSNLLGNFDWFSNNPFGNSSGTTTSNASSWANGSNLSGAGNYGLNTKQSIPMFKGFGK